MKYTSIIESFSGEHRWLSNFWIHDDARQLSVEHHYQAAKTTNLEDYLLIMSAETPGKAKRFGKQIVVRDDWDSVKFAIMEHLTREKYATNIKLRNMLLDTKGSLIIEGNTWGDRVWGVCEGIGENHLGKIIMRVRDQFL